MPGLMSLLTAPPNGLRISRCERAAYESVKKATISRAKRSDCMRMLGAGSKQIRGFDCVIIISHCVFRFRQADMEYDAHRATGSRSLSRLRFETHTTPLRSHSAEGVA